MYVRTECEELVHTEPHRCRDSPDRQERPSPLGPPPTALSGAHRRGPVDALCFYFLLSLAVTLSSFSFFSHLDGKASLSHAELVPEFLILASCIQPWGSPAWERCASPAAFLGRTAPCPRQTSTEAHDL